MTCIAGIVHNDYVYIGGERSISDQEVIIPLCRPKVHKINNWIFGYAGSIGTGQLFEFINFPEVVKDPYQILRLNIVEEYKKALTSFGNVTENNACDILVGYGNRLFEFNTDDWSVLEVEETAVGSGNNFALGSLYTTRTTIRNNPNRRIKLALESAIAYSPTCIGKIDIISTE